MKVHEITNQYNALADVITDESSDSSGGSMVETCICNPTDTTLPGVSSVKKTPHLEQDELAEAIEFMQLVEVKIRLQLLPL